MTVHAITSHRRRRGLSGALALAVLLAWAPTGGVEASPASFRLKETGVTVEFPPLARVTERDDSGTTWNVVGWQNGGLETVFDDFRLCLTRQGWAWNTVLVREQGSGKMALVVAQRGRNRLLLMLWESGPGVCGFSVGEDRDEEQ